MSIVYWLRVAYCTQGTPHQSDRCEAKWRFTPDQSYSTTTMTFWKYVTLITCTEDAKYLFGCFVHGQFIWKQLQQCRLIYFWGEALMWEDVGWTELHVRWGMWAEREVECQTAHRELSRFGQYILVAPFMCKMLGWRNNESTKMCHDIISLVSKEKKGSTRTWKTDIQ